MNERVIPLKFSIIALVVGVIGAFGQAYLLYHELADCLPYKVVDADFYRSIARTSIWLAPLIAVLVGAIFVRKLFWLSLILPVLLAPLLFAGIYKTFNVIYGFNTIADPDAFGDFTTAKAAEQFFSYCFSLAITGFVIGAFLAFLLWLIVRPKALA
jgi:hypothetical protein